MASSISGISSSPAPTLKGESSGQSRRSDCSGCSTDSRLLHASFLRLLHTNARQTFLYSSRLRLSVIRCCWDRELPGHRERDASESEASYDLVSGAASPAPARKEDVKEAKGASPTVGTVSSFALSSATV